MLISDLLIPEFNTGVIFAPTFFSAGEVNQLVISYHFT